MNEHGFMFNSDGSQDFYKSAASLVKSNNGFYRSAKQRWLLQSGKVFGPWGDWSQCNRALYAGITAEDATFLKTGFGVDAVAGNWVFMPEAMVSWAYGRRAKRRVGWVFVNDEFGVVRKYKLRYHYDDSTGASGVNEAKTVLEWERPADAVKPCFEEAKAAEPEVESKHVGIVGKRIVMELTVKGIKPCTTSWGQSTIVTMMDVFGNLIKTFTNIGDVKVGDKISIKATIVRHDTYKGVASTIVNRVKVI